MVDIIKEFQGEYRWLSNFWICKIKYDGIVFSSVEAAYQAAKTTDYKSRAIIATLAPGDAKRSGRQVNIRKDWENAKVGIMKELISQKFSDPGLRKKLLATGDAELQEGNNWNDVFWGISLKTGKGANTLGKILMQVRSDIQNTPQ